MDEHGLDVLRQDVREGRIDSDRLFDLLALTLRQLHESQRRNAELERELELARKQGPTQKVEQSFSVREEEKRQEARNKKKKQRKAAKRRGRRPTLDKVAQAAHTEKVFPEGVPEEDCTLSHTRAVWRLEGGRAVRVAYEIYRGPNNRYGQIPGALGRSEFGLEIMVAIAYLVYVVGLSFDKVCLLMSFFQNLTLRKSQVDALLNQLSRHWESEFETLCELLACSAVVHTDETSWSINSVWAFLSEQAQVLLFGVHKDGATLAQILDSETFQGILISDDASVYANFTHSQKCWAHLLRKAIKLTLMDPSNQAYRDFTDKLLEIYRQACRVQRDRRLSDEGRQRKVSELSDEVLELSGGIWAAELPKLEGPADDFRRLCNELMRLLLADELFTFVTASDVTAPNGEKIPVAGTNNEAERELRSPATARDTGRTSKSVRGARRCTVVTSVLQSLRRYLPEFNLSAILRETARWISLGQSCFAKQLARIRRRSKRQADVNTGQRSVLDTLLPLPAD